MTTFPARLLTLFPLVVCTFFSASVFSQKFSYGVQAGLNLHNVVAIPETGPDIFDPYVGYQASGFATLHFNNRLGISLEPGFAEKNIRIKSNAFNDGGVLQFRSMYLPVVLQYRIWKRWVVSAGPEIAYGISIRAKDKDINTDVSNSWNNKPEFSALAGLAFDLDENLSVGLRIHHNIIPISDIVTTDENGVDVVTSYFYNRGLQLLLRYRLD